MKMLEACKELVAVALVGIRSQNRGFKMLHKKASILIIFQEEIDDFPIRGTFTICQVTKRIGARNTVVCLESSVPEEVGGGGLF